MMKVLSFYLWMYTAIVLILAWAIGPAPGAGFERLHWLVLFALSGLFLTPVAFFHIMLEWATRK
jgi:hypothetical protein